MKNKGFILIPAADRARKLNTVIRNRTHNSLSQDQLENIVISLLPCRQYSVFVYTDPPRFCNALMLKRSEHRADMGRILFGQAMFGAIGNDNTKTGRLLENRHPAAAVIENHIGITEDPTLAIHIYVPPHLYMKGTGADDEQRPQTQNCI